jgi:hypothetical protein
LWHWGNHRLAFDIPRHLLDSLAVKGQDYAIASAQDISQTDKKVQDESHRLDAPVGSDAPSTSSLSCGLCGIQSKTVMEQRSHVRSDVHLFNLKRRMRNQSPVSEVEFEKMIEGMWALENSNYPESLNTD